MFNKYFANHSGYTDNIAGYLEEGRIDNVYHTFKVGEIDYLLLSLDHGTKDNVIEWANEVVAAHPTHRVIVTTHEYIRSDGSMIVTGQSGAASAYDPNNNNAEVLWEDFLSKHPNITMVLCGHADADDVVVSKQIGDYGNEVTQVLVDPQTMDAEYAQGSKGMVAMFYFSEDGTDVQVEYYSTLKDTYRPTKAFSVSLPVVKSESEFYGVSLGIGKDLSVRYSVTLAEGESIDGCYVEFTMNDKIVTVDDPVYDANTGKYVFTFCGIAPQCMGDSIRAKYNQDL